MAKAGGVNAEPVRNTDLLPTLCDLAGVRAPTDRAIDGVSSRLLLEGKPLNRAVPLY